MILSFLWFRVLSSQLVVWSPLTSFQLGSKFHLHIHSAHARGRRSPCYVLRLISGDVIAMIRWCLRRLFMALLTDFLLLCLVNLHGCVMDDQIALICTRGTVHSLKFLGSRTLQFSFSIAPDRTCIAYLLHAFSFWWRDGCCDFNHPVLGHDPSSKFQQYSSEDLTEVVHRLLLQQTCAYICATN